MSSLGFFLLELIYSHLNLDKQVHMPPPSASHQLCNMWPTQKSPVSLSQQSRHMTPVQTRGSCVDTDTRLQCRHRHTAPVQTQTHGSGVDTWLPCSLGTSLQGGSATFPLVCILSKEHGHSSVNSFGMNAQLILPQIIHVYLIRSRILHA